VSALLADADLIAFALSTDLARSGAGIAWFKDPDGNVLSLTRRETHVF
jgi:hypothetical protein